GDQLARHGRRASHRDRLVPRGAGREPRRGRPLRRGRPDDPVFVKLPGRRLTAPALLAAAGPAAFLATALAAPWLSPHDPAEAHLLDRLRPPASRGGDPEYPLGTDHLGRDMLSRLLHGSRVALAVGFAGVLLA